MSRSLYEKIKQLGMLLSLFIGILGYVLNVTRLLDLAFSPTAEQHTLEMSIRIVGCLIMPLGSVMGFVP